MKISPFIFLAIFCFFITPVSAIDFSEPNIHCVAHGVAPYGYTGDADNLILIGSGTSVLMSDTIGSGITANSITNFPSSVSGVYSTKNWIYVILDNGLSYKIESSIYQRDFGDLVFSGDDRDGYFLGDYCTYASGRYNNRIFVDSKEDIFIYSAYDETLYKLDGDSYISTTFLSSTDIAAMYGAFGQQYISFSVYSNAIYTIGADSGVDLDVFRVTAPSTYTKIYDNAITSSDSALDAYIVALENDNFIIGSSYTTTPITKIYEYNTTSPIGTVYNGGGYFGATHDQGNIIVKPNGILVYASTGNDKIVTFNTVSGAGGVYTEEGTTPAEITYNSKSVNAEYETYYNQTNVNFKWSLAIDDDFIDTYNSVYSEPIYNRYYWQIELFSPDDIFINSYIIPANWKYQSYTLGIFGQGDYVNSGNVDFNHIVGNGTYTVKIYELNRITGAKAFLDSDKFIILSQTNPSSAGSVSETTGEGAAYNFLNSPYLVAIIIIGIVGFQFGRGSDGNINGTAMIVLIPLAVGLCCLMGLLPMWILYVMVLCIIAFVAVKMSTGGS